ncbi:MAG: type II toxin-antitoxin system prevent-host-death family antitoxin [Rhodocyclales bacterium]|nr:type II toxin-antitoxin system prevent-host-death family antitoxin [Rhodocyclales bacterium]
MMQVSMSEARKCLSSLVAAAERGEDAIIARDGKPVARIVRYEAPKVKPPGAWKGKVKVSSDWDSPETNAEIAALFDGVAGPVSIARGRG